MLGTKTLKISYAACAITPKPKPQPVFGNMPTLKELHTARSGVTSLCLRTDVCTDKIREGAQLQIENTHARKSANVMSRVQGTPLVHFVRYLNTNNGTMKLEAYMQAGGRFPYDDLSNPRLTNASSSPCRPSKST